MKQKLLSFRALFLVLMVTLFTGQTWGTDVTGTITFGNGTGATKISAASVTGTDTQNNTWTITTVGTTSFTANAAYYQVGASKSPATSITFTTTLSADQDITAFSASFGGFSGTAGTVTLQIDDVTVGTGSLNATSDVNITNENGATGKTLTVTVTGISKGVKCYNISYTYNKPESGKTETTTAFPASSYTAYIGGDAFTAPTATVSDATAEVSGATVTYASSAEGVATVDASTGAVTLVAPGTATITASYAGDETYEASEASYTLNVGKVYVSLAELVADGAPTTDGIQVQVTLTDETIQSIFTTSAGYRNGIFLKSGEQEVEIYCKYVPTNWAANGTVSGTITGAWKLYGTSTWELCPTDWTQFSYTAPAKSNQTITLGTYKASLEANGNADSYTATTDGDGELSVESSNTGVATVAISEGTVTVTPVAKGTTTITVTAAATDACYEGSKSYTLTVTEPVTPAELPFSYDLGAADATPANGMTATGLGSDYSASPKLKFDGTGDELVISFNATDKPKTLSYTIKGNSFSGGTFDVMESADGETYTSVKSYTTFATTATAVELDLAAASRFVKFVYTTKSAGNVALGAIGIAYAPFSASNKSQASVKNKFYASPLTVVYNNYEEGMTVKVNSEETTYDATNGLTIKSQTGSKTNDTYNVQVYNGEELVAQQTYTWIPTAASVSAFKQYEDDVEAILSMSNAKVTYVTSDGKGAYIQDGTRGIYAYGLGLEFTAYTQSKVTIWGKKTTFKNVVELVSTTETADNSSVTPSTTSVTPTAKTVAQANLADNQLTYIKMSGAKIVKEESGAFYAEAGNDRVLLYDQFATSALTNLGENVPCYADVTGIVSISAKGVVQVLPTAALENVCTELAGICGEEVKWTIDLDGNMVFAPTNGQSGTMAALGIAASKRPWSSYVTSVKTVKFEAGVATAADPSYMFKDMANLESVDFTNLNISAATKMNGLFQNCSSIKDIDMSGLDLSAVTNFQQTFNGDSLLTNVNFGDNTLAAATNMNSMFSGCKTLESLDFGNVTGAAVTNMASMLYQCTALETVDFSNFSTANVSSAANAKNVFGVDKYAALPSLLVLSKDFGKIATGEYITLPANLYCANEKFYDLANSDADTRAAAQAALYADNEAVKFFDVYGKNYIRDVESGAWGTICLPVAVEEVVGATIYTITSTENGIVEMETVTGELEAGKPYLYQAETSEYHTSIITLGYTATSLTTSTVKDNYLYGCFEETSLDKYNAEDLVYVLQCQNDRYGFYLVDPTKQSISVPAYHAYLINPVEVDVKAFYLDNNGEETAISSLDAEKAADTTIFNLAGQRINKAQKGVNIINGKKVLK